MPLVEQDQKVRLVNDAILVEIAFVVGAFRQGVYLNVIYIPTDFSNRAVATDSESDASIRPGKGTQIHGDLFHFADGTGGPPGSISQRVAPAGVDISVVPVVDGMDPEVLPRGPAVGEISSTPPSNGVSNAKVCQNCMSVF